MGIPDSSLLDLILNIKSWISWGTRDLSSFSGEFKMADKSSKICWNCMMNLAESCIRYHCQICGRMLCENCVQENDSFGVVLSSDMSSTTEAGFVIKSCTFCFDISIRNKLGRKYCEKIHPSESPQQSPEPPSPSSSGERFSERFDGCSPHAAGRCSVAAFTSNPSSVSVPHSPSRSDEDDRDDPTKHFFSSYCNDMSDVDSSSVSARHEFSSFKSVGSSPSDSPFRIHITSNRVGHFVQQEQGRKLRSQNDGPFDQETLSILERPDTETDYPDYNCEKADNLSIFQDQREKLPKPLDFENNSLVWFPPPPDDENDEREDYFFSYDDDDDDDDYVGNSSVIFSSSNSLNGMLTEKEKQNGDHKEPLRAAVRGHFRALVSQLLLGEGIKLDKENCQDDWLDVVTAISWQAANFVKPDTSRGGSMDPGDYVKVKCIASGSPSESTFVKGIVCTKNIKHKRMTSQYRNPRLLFLGGALEYQRAPNQLASFDTLLQQEIDHLKMIVSKIEAHRPNVLLVEKTVSSYAQEYLLAKEISLVLNVKRPLLEQIARCTGASITPSVDKLSTTRLGHCELFRLEKVSEELEGANQLNRKPSKTLMFFEGCPRRLGCTVLLKGSCREELKKVKHVVQYAVFAAYHLSLETSFLADEGASLPKLKVKPSISVLERAAVDSTISLIPTSVAPTSYPESADLRRFDEFAGLNLELGEGESVIEPFNSQCSPTSVEYSVGPSNELGDGLATTVAPEEYKPNLVPTDNKTCDQEECLDPIDNIQRQPAELPDLKNFEEVYEMDASSEYYSVTDNHQSILVSFSSRRVLNGTVCERSRLLRIKFYGCFDKPLGRYLQDDLFDQMAFCRSCKEPAEGHVVCYTHQQGNLTINVKCLPSVKLPGERDGKIWMWHRCLRCANVGGIPPATRRVVMSDAAWGLSFGKFLELSFSNHATGNRVASCGHSLQRDCLRYYGLGSMVAFFRYSPIDILSVYLPPSVLEFIPHAQQDWLKKEVAEFLNKSEALYEEISGVFQSIEQKSTSLEYESFARNELQNNIMEFKEQLIKERNDYKYLLQLASKDSSELGQVAMDIFELNRWRHSLLIGSHDWARRLYSLDSLLSSKGAEDVVSYAELKDWRSVSSLKDSSFAHDHEENVSEFTNFQDSPQKDLQSEQKGEPDISLNDSDVPEFFMSTSRKNDDEVEIHSDGESAAYKTSLERAPSAASELSDKIDAVWSGSGHLSLNSQLLQSMKADGPEAASLGQMNNIYNPPFRRLSLPARVYSFDSAIRIQERIRKGLGPSSLHLSTVRSFHASGDYRNMVRDPLSNVQRSSYTFPRDAQKFNHWSTKPLFISAASLLPKGARLFHPQNGQNNLIIAVYDNDPTSIISYALSSKEYKNWIADEPNGFEGAWDAARLKKENSVASTFSAWQSFGSLDLDYIHYGSYGSEDASTTIGTLFTDPKSSPHLRVSFEDKSSDAGGNVKFSVTCYFPKQFDALRKKCGCSEVDLVRSLSRCRRWSAQGGKSNVYFAKSLDERFIIKQVTKTELESFEEFAPEYFKYLTDSLNSRSPTCLAKVLGLFQVTVKHLKGGKETKMDMMVMENLFFRRNISRVYDLKGSARSRYNSDATGANKVLLDMNLLEALRTKPMFLGSKAKRSLERAVWNDTSFLASVDVMDYSLLVGVDDVRKELVLGIIDYMRQYTWDKYLETWVKASGILGGPNNASPTIVSPKQYKKRFRKAMTTYFLTVPDQWSS